MSTTRQTPEEFGWTAEDLRSAYASDGSGPFSYDVDGSGPWLVGPEPERGRARFAPRDRSGRGRLRRIGTACTAGALTLVLAVGSVAVIAHSAPPHAAVQAGVVHSADTDGA